MIFAIWAVGSVLVVVFNYGASVLNDTWDDNVHSHQ